MMIITATRRLEFDYGHRVLGHAGKCKHLHGHRGVAEVTVEADRTDDLGMVIDFSKVKELVGGWIDQNWDHNFLCHPSDPIRHLSEDPGQPVGFASAAKAGDVLGWRAPFVMPPELPNPTAENMAAVLLGEARRLLYRYKVRVVRVRLYETPNCYAEASS